MSVQYKCDACGTEVDTDSVRRLGITCRVLGGPDLEDKGYSGQFDLCPSCLPIVTVEWMGAAFLLGIKGMVSSEEKAE